MSHKQIKQKKGEADKMVKAGFPRCFGKADSKISQHCNTCIRLYRRLLEILKEVKK